MLTAGRFRRKPAMGTSWLALMLLIPALALGAEAFSPFGSLQQRLVKDGFSPAYIQRLYADPRAGFDTRGVSLYFVHRESSLNYDQFLDAAPIAKARQYMADHAEALTRAERRYGVDREVITAIALVETRLGTYVGKRAVFNTLSTMAALADTAVRNRLWADVSGDTRLSRTAFEDKARSKAGWAYNELRAFLTYVGTEENLDPLEIQGSYAGAMGICQFMPSNIGKLAADGNGDGRINLFDHDDAIMSIASYLNHYGWYQGIPEDGAYKAVYRYNHSRYYVNTILEIRRVLSKT